MAIPRDMILDMRARMPHHVQAEVIAADPLTGTIELKIVTVFRGNKFVGELTSVVLSVRHRDEDVRLGGFQYSEQDLEQARYIELFFDDHMRLINECTCFMKAPTPEPVLTFKFRRPRFTARMAGHLERLLQWLVR